MTWSVAFFVAISIVCLRILSVFSLQFKAGLLYGAKPLVTMVKWLVGIHPPTVVTIITLLMWGSKVWSCYKITRFLVLSLETHALSYFTIIMTIINLASLQPLLFALFCSSVSVVRRRGGKGEIPAAQQPEFVVPSSPKRIIFLMQNLLLLVLLTTGQLSHQACLQHLPPIAIGWGVDLLSGGCVSSLVR